MIPKILHIVWIGDESKRPDAAIATWRSKNPDFELRIWGNSELHAEKWSLPQRMTAWLRHELVGCVDIMRWEILLKYGGIALDADRECLQPLPEWLLQTCCFASWENEIVKPGLISNSVVGGVPEHRLFRQVLVDIFRDPNPLDGMAWQKTGPQRLTETVRSQRVLDLTVYPSHYFSPEHFGGTTYQGRGPVFSSHQWSSTKHYRDLAKERL